MSVGPDPSHDHEHDWRPPQDDSAVTYEDGCVVAFEHCDFAEVTGSATSERLDETFYEYGYECEATRAHRFRLSRIELLGDADAAEIYVEEMSPLSTVAQSPDEVRELYDRVPRLVERIEQRARQRLCEHADGYPEAHDWTTTDGVVTDDHRITVEAGGDHYRLTYAHEGVSHL